MGPGQPAPEGVVQPGWTPGPSRCLSVQQGGAGGGDVTVTTLSAGEDCQEG